MRAQCWQVIEFLFANIAGIRCFSSVAAKVCFQVLLCKEGLFANSTLWRLFSNMTRFMQFKHITLSVTPSAKLAQKPSLTGLYGFRLMTTKVFFHIKFSKECLRANWAFDRPFSCVSWNVPLKWATRGVRLTTMLTYVRFLNNVFRGCTLAVSDHRGSRKLQRW